jgi:shikimate kinase
VSGDCRILLIGMMGSGKSTIGRLLSDITGWPYVDNDELVLRATGMVSRQLLAERGEEALREAESAALSAALELEPPVVAGVAAGVVTDPDARRALADGGVVVWLTAAPEVLAQRAAGAAHRPFLDEDPLTWMTARLAEREPLYASVADVEIWTDVEPPEDAALRLHRWLRAIPPCAGAVSTEAGRPS